MTEVVQDEDVARVRVIASDLYPENGCEHGFRPVDRCPNDYCEKRDEDLPEYESLIRVLDRLQRAEQQLAMADELADHVEHSTDPRPPEGSAGYYLREAAHRYRTEREKR